MLRRIGLGVVALVLLTPLAWLGGVGPAAFLPGGILWGEPAQAPADWSFTNSIPEVQLQTRRWGFFPWSVVTWVMTDGPTLYIGASECDRVWTNVVKEYPEVRVRIDGRIYSMLMLLEERPEVGQKLAPVVLEKYMGIAVDSANFADTSTGCMFRLEPRS